MNFPKPIEGTLHFLLLEILPRVGHLWKIMSPATIQLMLEVSRPSHLSRPLHIGLSKCIVEESGYFIVSSNVAALKYLYIDVLITLP